MRAVDKAIALAISRLERTAAIDLPADVQAERVSEGLRLTGANLRHRWLTDVRLRGLSIAGRAP